MRWEVRAGGEERRGEDDGRRGEPRRDVGGRRCEGRRVQESGRGEKDAGEWVQFAKHSIGLIMNYLPGIEAENLPKQVTSRNKNGWYLYNSGKKSMAFYRNGLRQHLVRS